MNDSMDASVALEGSYATIKNSLKKKNLMDFCILFLMEYKHQSAKQVFRKNSHFFPQLKIQKQGVCTVVAFLYLDRHFQPKLLVLPWNDELMHHCENSQK